MRDIREIEPDSKSAVRQLLKEFFQGVDEAYRLKPDNIELMLNFWLKGDIVILGKFDNNEILGIAVLGLVSNRLSLVYASNHNAKLDENRVMSLERELFDAGFERLKERQPWVLTQSMWWNVNVTEYARQLGFKRYDSLEMSAGRAALAAMEIPPVQRRYTLQNYNKKWEDAIAALTYECFQGTPDAEASPHELSSPEKCLDALNDTVIKDGVGAFKSGRYSWVLREGNEIIGVNFQTLQSDTRALVAGLCVKPSHQRRGLGKMLLIHSLRDLLRNESDVTEIVLYVSSTNHARNLYNSIGFNENKRYFTHTWNSEQTN